MKHMDPHLFRTISYVIVILGTAFVLIGTIGIHYFSGRLEASAPYRQPIRTATATVEVTILSDEDVHTHYADRGGYIVFVKGKEEQGKEELLVMSSTDCNAKQTGKGQVIYHAVFNMNATDKAVGKPIYTLKETEYAQIYFWPMPKESKILFGKAICTFNSRVQIEITIPSQEIANGQILVHNLENVFSKFVK